MSPGHVTWSQCLGQRLRILALEMSPVCLRVSIGASRNLNLVRVALFYFYFLVVLVVLVILSLTSFTGFSRSNTHSASAV